MFSESIAVENSKLAAEIEEERKDFLQESMFPNPDLSHLNSKDYDSVYEPSGNITILKINSYHMIEDTFLLMDALEEAVNDLRTMQPLICMEIG